MFKKEVVKNYKELIQFCFLTDSDLTEKWHISAGKGINTCVEKTVNDLKDCQTQVFKVTDGDDIVGYFGKEICYGNIFLTGFFITPKFRTAIGRNDFWQSIESELPKPFFCGVYEKNIPANKFIKSRSGTLIKSLDLPDGPASYYRIGS